MEAFAVRRAQGRLLIRPSARTIRWTSFTMIAATGGLVVWTAARDQGDPTPVALPIASALLCVWLCFLFEDLTAETTASSATPLLFRRALRAAIAVPAVATVWFAYAWIGPSAGPTSHVTKAFVASIALSLAAGATAVRLSDSGRGGFAAAAVVVFILLVLPVAIGRPPSIDPARPPLGEPLAYWSAITIISCAVLALAHLDRFQRRS
jgi:hypothetical protein